MRDQRARYGKLDDRWLRIEKISIFLNDKNVNAKSMYRPNYDQNGIPLENWLILMKL